MPFLVMFPEESTRNLPVVPIALLLDELATLLITLDTAELATLDTTLEPTELVTLDTTLELLLATDELIAELDPPLTTP